MTTFLGSSSGAARQISKFSAALSLAVAIINVVPAVADAAEDCKSAKSIDVKIAACSTEISGGNLANRVLAQAHLRRGTAYHDKKDFDAAIKDYDTAIKIDPTYALAHYERGSSKAAKGDADGAISDLDTSIGLDNSHANSFVERGVLWRKKGDLNKAISDYSEAIRLDPKKATSHLNRGIAYNKRGDKDLAIGDFNKAIELKPQASNYYERAVAYLGKGDKTAGTADLKKALELDPEYAPAKGRLAAINGVAVANTAPPTAAGTPPAQPTPVAQPATTPTQPTTPAPQLSSFETCTQSKDIDARIASCAVALKDANATPQTIARSYLARASAYAVRGQDDLAQADAVAALKPFDDAVKSAPSDAELAAFRYSAYQRDALYDYKKGNHADALAKFEKMKAIDPNDEFKTSEWIAGAKAHAIKITGTSFKVELPTIAENVPAANVKPVPAAAPQKPAAPVAIGPPAETAANAANLASCKQFEDLKAKENACTALISDKSYPPSNVAFFYIARASVYMSRKQPDLALADIESSIRTQSSGMAFAVRGALRYPKDPAGGMRDTEEAFRLDPNNPEVVRMRYNAYERDAFLAYKAGDRVKAVPKFEKLLALDPKDMQHATQWLAAAKAGTIKVEGLKFTIGTASNSIAVEFDQ
jgi:tetratricopeptide (TPR) repeat protein